MLDRLSRRATVLLLGAVFGLTFTVQLLLSDESSAPQGEVRAHGASAPATAAAPKVRLVAAGRVPALREPRRPEPVTPAPTAAPPSGDFDPDGD